MVDINIKVPALEMLLKYAASGIGAVAGPALAPWKARQDAAVRQTKAQSEADSSKLIAEAIAEASDTLSNSDIVVQGTVALGQEGIEQRLKFQERKRQANIISTV